MHIDIRVCLFGGALFCAGVASADPEFSWTDHDAYLSIDTGCYAPFAQRRVDVAVSSPAASYRAFADSYSYAYPYGGYCSSYSESDAEVSWSPSGIDASVLMNGYGGVAIADAVNYSASGPATHDFSVTEDAIMTLDWFASSTSLFELEVVEVGSGTVIFSEQPQFGGGMVDLPLLAGQVYQIRHRVEVNFAFGSGNWSATLSPAPTCTADVTTDGTSNGVPDGAVTLSDFSFYLSLWSASSPSADVTTDGTSNGIPDGSVTLSDFSYYLSLWSAGCP